MGPNSTNPRVDRQEDLQPDSAPRVDAPPAANVIVLADDATLLEMIKHSLEGRQNVWRANSALHAADLLLASQFAILFIDAALTRHETPALVDSLHGQFPDFAIVVTGRRDDEIELAERISTGAVFRFLHKPVSAERVRHFIDAAVRRSGEQLARTTSPASDRPSAPARALSTVRSIRLPQVEVDPARIKRRLRSVVSLALVLLLGWGLVTIMQHRPREQVSPPFLAGPSPAGSSQAVLAGTHQDDALAATHQDDALAATRQDDALAVALGAAAIALSQGRLVEPEGQNALELYRSVLRADPDNAEARTGLGKTTEELLLRVEQRLLAEDLTGAASALDTARSADPDNPRLEFLSSQLARARDDVKSSTVATAAGSVAAERAQGERVARLLALADQRTREGRLVGGFNSAEAYVLDARETAPGDAGVQQALSALSGRMLLSASEAMNQGDMVAAGGWLDRADSLGVDGKSVARLRAQIAAVQLASVHEDHSRLLALANQRIAQGRLLEPAGDSARHYADLLRAADPGFDGLAETEALLAARLLEQAGPQSATGRHAEADDRSQAADATGVVAEETLAKVEYRAPAYPARAASRGTEGWVDVQFTVAADGSTRDVAVTGSSPAGIFERSVLDAIRDWRYEPRVVAGKPVDQRVKLRVRFALGGN